MMFDGLGSSATHIKSGRIRRSRWRRQARAGLPRRADRPKAGVPNYQVATWYGLWAPKGTPRELIDRDADRDAQGARHATS